MKGNLFTDFVRYQKDRKLLDVTDSPLIIERRYIKDFSDSSPFSYSDSTETLRLIKKRYLTKVPLICRCGLAIFSYFQTN